jgi:amino acid transporter
MWLTRLAGFASLVQVFVAYLAYFWPAAESGAPRIAIITSLVVVLTLINLIGVKQSARASDIFAVSKLIPLLLFVFVGFFFIDGSRFTFSSTPAFGTFTSAVFVLLYAFSGFEAVLVNSGEVNKPQRVIPFALIMALSIAVVLYMFIQVSMHQRTA